MEDLLAAIEAGGTKFNLALFSTNGEKKASYRVPTEEPGTTLPACLAALKKAAVAHGSVKALGIASFGPICLDIDDSQFGEFLNTPKDGWSGVNIVDYFRNRLDCPVALDSDVNAAALAEFRHRNRAGNIAYVTVGTGVGVGVCLDGKTLKGCLHPELGHMPLARASGEAKGVCAAHGDCVEGLISGPALAARWQQAPETLGHDHPVWASTAHYLAQLCMTICLAYSPYKIVIGGGVVESGYLLAGVRKRFIELIGGYLADRCFPDGLDLYIEQATTLEAPGLRGAYELARDIYHDS